MKLYSLPHAHDFIPCKINLNDLNKKIIKNKLG